MDAFLETIASYSPLIIYTLLLLAAYLENIVPPIPGDTVVIFGAYLVGIEKIDFLPSLIFTTIGSIAGFMTYYAIGRYGGREFFERRNYKWFDADSINRVDIWFDKRGMIIILANRFLAGTRSVISIFAGISKLPWLKVMIFAAISSFAWNGILITAGYYAGKNWKVVRSMLQNYNLVVSVLVVVTISVALLMWLKSKKSDIKE